MTLTSLFRAAVMTVALSVAVIAFAASPQPALATTSFTIQATVIPDCKFSTTTLAGGTLNLGNIPTTGSPASNTFSATILCNVGTKYTPSVPASVTLNGFSDSGFTQPIAGNPTIVCSLSVNPSVATADVNGTTTPDTIVATATAPANDYTTGFYKGTFVLTVAY